MDRALSKEELIRERQKKLIRIGIVVGVVLAAILALNAVLKSSVTYASLSVCTVDQGLIEVTVNASGKVVPAFEEVIVSPIVTKILEVYKHPGDQLEKGDAILKLELSAVETAYQQKLDEHEMKKSKLVQADVNLKNRISDLRMQQKIKEMKLKQTYTEWQSERYLDSIGASTADKIRQAELNYEVTRLELDQLQEKVENEHRNSEAEIKVQQLDLSIFEKSMQESARLLKDARVLSPQAATLTYVSTQLGATVGAGEQIAIISDLSAFKVEAEMADSYAERVSPGARAVVRIGDLRLNGTVVNLTPSAKNGLIKFTVMLTNNNHAKLRSGLKTDVYVLYEIREEVLRIRNAPFYRGPGEYELWVIKDHEALRKTVELGESNYEYVEVVSGLQKGDELVISDMSDFKNNKKLKIN